MDVVGRGAQYLVIDTHDGRVRKVPLTRQESRQVVAGWYAPAAAPAEELAVDYLEMTRKACATVKRVITSHPEAAASLGHPVFEDGSTYTQDKVQTLGQRLESASLEDAKRLLAGFTELVIQHWRFGFSDLVFNCVVNNGVTPDGKVILIDFGELTDRKADVAARISSQGWLTAWSYKQGLPEPCRIHFRELMAVRLTHAALDAVWATA